MKRKRENGLGTGKYEFLEILRKMKKVRKIL